MDIDSIKKQREYLQRAIAGEGLPQVLNEWQLTELSAVLSTEYLYAAGILTDASYSETAMYGYIMALQHVRELLRSMSTPVE